MSNKYRTKPTTVTAVRFDGHNVDEILQLCPGLATFFTNRNSFLIDAFTGDATVRVGDWVVRDARGLLVCDDTKFKATYEPMPGFTSSAATCQTMVEKSE